MLAVGAALPCSALPALLRLPSRQAANEQTGSARKSPINATSCLPSAERRLLHQRLQQGSAGKRALHRYELGGGYDPEERHR